MYCEFVVTINVANCGYEWDVRMSIYDTSQTIRKYPKSFATPNEQTIMFEWPKKSKKGLSYKKVYFCFGNVDNNAVFDDVSEHYKCKITSVYLLQ
jgi:hypothetical protein